MDSKLICVLGYIGSGKDTVARHIERTYRYKRDSFAAPLKDVCSAVFGWPRDMVEGDTEESRLKREQVDEWWSEKLGIPNFSPRLGLQLLGTELFRDNFHKDIWLLSLKHRFETFKGNGVVISDCRFANEIQLAKALGGVLLYVDNGAKPEWFNTARDACNGDGLALETMLTKYKQVHRSEWEWANVEPDYVIDNSFEIKTPLTYDELRNRVDAIMRQIIGKI